MFGSSGYRMQLERESVSALPNWHRWTSTGRARSPLPRRLPVRRSPPVPRPRPLGAAAPVTALVPRGRRRRGGRRRRRRRRTIGPHPDENGTTAAGGPGHAAAAERALIADLDATTGGTPDRAPSDRAASGPITSPISPPTHRRARPIPATPARRPRRRPASRAPARNCGRPSDAAHRLRRPAPPSRTSRPRPCSRASPPAKPPTRSCCDDRAAAMPGRPPWPPSTRPCSATRCSARGWPPATDPGGRLTLTPTRRCATRQRPAIAAAGLVPVPPRADYPALYPVTGAAAARALAVRLENACAAAWRFLYLQAASTPATAGPDPAHRGPARAHRRARYGRRDGVDSSRPPTPPAPFPGI